MHNKIIFSLLLALVVLMPESGGQDLKILKDKLSSPDDLEKIAALHKLVDIYIYTSLDTTILYGQQSLRLAKSLKKDSLIAESYICLANAYYFKGDTDSSLIYTLEAQKIGHKINSAFILADTYQRLASNHSQLMDFEKALEFNEKAIDYWTLLNDNLKIADIYYNTSRIYEKMGKYEEGLSYVFKSEEIFTEYQDTIKQGSSASLIASHYMSMGKIEKALPYLNKAKNILKRDIFPIRHSYVLQKIGYLFFNETKLDSALYYFLECLDINKSLGSLTEIARSHNNIGSVYLEMGKWEKSYIHFHKSLNLKRQLNDKRGQAFAYTNLGDYHSKYHNIDSAEYYYLMALDLADTLKIAYLKGVVLANLYEFYKNNNEYKKALNYFEQHSKHLDETKGLEVEKKIVELEAKYESEKKEREIERLELQNEVQASKTKAFSIGLLSLFAFSFLIIMGILYRKRNEKKLYAVKQKMHEQEKNELDKALEFKTKQLASHALHMVQKNKILQELKLSISTIATQAPAQEKKALQSLIRRINFNIQSDEDWNTFKLYFEQTNQKFYRNLAKVNDKLSPTELKLCALIKLNMNIKETAAVLNIEPTSVKTARHRLRKKLKLEVGEDLSVFIRNVA